MPGPVHVKEIIGSVLARYSLDSDTSSVFDVWEKELGRLSKYIRLIGKSKKSLLVRVTSPAYRQELRYRKREFLRKINGHYGSSIADDIKIKQ